MSSTNYVSYPITVNPTDLLAEAIAYIKSKAPAWVDNDANLDVWILQILTSQSADLRALASDVPDSIFRYFGANLIGIAPIDAIQAQCTSTWTMRDTAGYTIPDGTYVSIHTASGEIPFQTVGDVVVPPGSGATSAGQVPLVAVNPGAASSGIGAALGVINLIDTLDYVTGIVQVAVTTGGQDAETTAQYQDRLVRRLRRLSTRPILPDDFSNMALDIAGIYRAVAIDGYNPADSTYGNERMITLAGIDIAGIDLDGTTKTALQNYIEANREANFICNVMNAQRTTIDVNFTALAVDGNDPATVQAAIVAALNAYLNPATWGQDPRFSTTAAAQTWVDTVKAYFYEIAQTISDVQGVARLSALSIGKHGFPLGGSDVDLTSPASLAVAGTITGTVS